MGEFLLGGRGDRPDLIIARIPFAGEALDDAALPRCVPALERNDRAAPMDDVRIMDVAQPLLDPGERLVASRRRNPCRLRNRPDLSSCRLRARQRAIRLVAPRWRRANARVPAGRISSAGSPSLRPEAPCAPRPTSAGHRRPRRICRAAPGKRRPSARSGRSGGPSTPACPGACRASGARRARHQQSRPCRPPGSSSSPARAHRVLPRPQLLLHVIGLFRHRDAFALDIELELGDFATQRGARRILRGRRRVAGASCAAASPA